LKIEITLVDMPETEVKELGDLSCSFKNSEKIGTAKMVLKDDRVYTCDLDLTTFSEDLLISRGLNVTVVSEAVANSQIEPF